MKPNMGSLDRIVRVVVAVVVIALVVSNVVAGLAAIILGALAGIFLLTSAISFCPLYLPFGISTRPRS
ncbi:MAG: DUF2892 domain-containing protein [Roseiflexaceae bacterium]